MTKTMKRGGRAGILSCLLVLSLVLSLFGPASPVLAVNQPPHQFWGNVTIGGVQAPTGTLVEAKIDGNLYASTTVDANQVYNYGWVPAFTVPTDNLADLGKTIQFWVAGVLSGTYQEGVPVTPVTLMLGATGYNNSGKPLDLRAAASSAKAITVFNFNALTPAVTGVINETAKTIALAVPFGTVVTALVPTITITGASVAPASGVAQNFTSTVSYNVTAADLTTQLYTVTVTIALNTAKAITAFDFIAPPVVGVINETAHTILLAVPFGTDRTALVPTITITGASVTPASGVAQNFTAPVSYNVTAADTTTQLYAVTVTVALSSAKAITVFDFNALTPPVVGVINETAVPKTIALTVPYGTNVTALVPTITINGTSVAPASLVPQNFTAPVSYNVTAADLTTQVYTVTVTVAAVPANPTAPVLGEAGRFVILASQKVTTTVGSHIINGDIGIEDQARSYYEGFTAGANPGQFTELTNGLSYAHDDIDPALTAGYPSTIAFLDQVRTDLGIAYTYLAADPNPGAPTQVCPIQLGGLTLTRGVYKTASNVGITTGPLHLDAQGDPNSVWIFSIGGTLTTGAPGGNIFLDNGALAKNVYWRTAGVTVIGAGTAFYGNVFAWTQVNVLAGANITGRLFAVTEQVTLISDTVTNAAPSSAKAITAFNFTAPPVIGVINETAHTILLAVPFGTDRTALVPTIIITGASVTPASLVPQNFTSTVSYTVTAADTTTQLYTVNVTPLPSNDATLSNLTISSGTLTPAFASGNISYTDSVVNSVSNVTVTPTVNESNATVKVNAVAVTSGSPSGAIPLSVGANTITVVVTAQDMTTNKTYTVTVTRAAPLSSDATLSNLTISSGTLTPVFASGTTIYTDSVVNSVSNVTVTPTVNEGNATVTVNTVAVASGSPSGAISLSVGASTITVVVTAQDTTTNKTYTITVTRAAPLSSDATLSNLTISSGTLTPVFASGTTIYTDSVVNSVSNVTVTPTVNEGNATVTVNTVAVASGSPSGAIPLSVGASTITVVVTAQDTTTKTYTITVTRAGAGSSDATLSNLTISSGTLTPVFASGTTIYTDSVVNSVSNVTVTPTANESHATVKVNNVDVASGSPSGAIPLSVGASTITIVVTAQDMTTTKTYTVTVTRAATYTLTYTAGANGTISGTSPQTVASGGTGTAVTAVANTTYHFVNWNDTSTANPRTDTNVTGNISVTANFAINTYTLTYTAGANGTISGTSPQTVASGGNGTAVTAVANTTYHFVNWNDTSTANPRTDTNVTGNITVTANFAINITYTLTYTAGANGTITGTLSQTVVSGANGTAVTAVPSAGYHFVNWSDASTANPRTDTNVTGNITVTATFSPIPTYALTMAVVGNGTATDVTNASPYASGASVSIKAVPAASYRFVNWTATAGVFANATAAETTFTMPGVAATVTATFTFVATPTITSFTPASGGTGTTVTINGTNLSGATAVSFGGTAATNVTVVSATQVTAKVGSGTTGTVSVTTPAGTATSTGTFTFIATPTITLFTPPSGGTGTTVTINGTNLTGATAVSFGGTAATSFIVNSATQITAKVGSGTTGTVSVTTPGGTATSTGIFTFLSLADLINGTGPGGTLTLLSNVTYTGNVTINHSMNITGTGGTVISGSIIIGNLTASAVTIENLTITGYGAFGIKIVKVKSGETFIIRNNTILGVPGSVTGIEVVEVVGGNLTMTQNTIIGNQVGINLLAAVAAGSINGNNITNNTAAGLQVAAGGNADAAGNWWGDISGPKHGGTMPNPGGIGNKLVGDISYEPWLTRQFQTVLKDNIAYVGFAMVRLNVGWNTFSIPIAMDPAGDTWGEYVALGDGLSIHATNPAYSFNGQTQTWVALTGDYPLKPCDAIYVRMASPDVAPILVSPDTSVPSKQLYAGWNLVGLAYLGMQQGEVGGLKASQALISVAEVSGGLTGYKVVVSPPMNQQPWIYIGGPIADWDGTGDAPDGWMFKTSGYWVFMLNNGTLAGFTFTPVSLPNPLGK